ncbi:hypothetical protein RSJ42_13885 [Methanosarcina hadiensis]|uniref:hypothetical protein n=1 Tax=Methanosarcina hadiensis TaxID=3078083 RepID=UPI0039774E92
MVLKSFSDMLEGRLKADKTRARAFKGKTLTFSHLRSVDPVLLSTARSLSAVKRSFSGLIITALFQILIIRISGSVALLADTIHNFGDAATAVSPGFAFLPCGKTR